MNMWNIVGLFFILFFKGTYGVVYKAISIDGKTVALKKIRLDKYDCEKNEF